MQPDLFHDASGAPLYAPFHLCADDPGDGAGPPDRRRRRRRRPDRRRDRLPAAGEPAAAADQPPRRARRRRRGRGRAERRRKLRPRRRGGGGHRRDGRAHPARAARAGRRVRRGRTRATSTCKQLPPRRRYRRAGSLRRASGRRAVPRLRCPTAPGPTSSRRSSGSSSSASWCTCWSTSWSRLVSRGSAAIGDGRRRRDARPPRHRRPERLPCPRGCCSSEVALCPCGCIGKRKKGSFVEKTIQAAPACMRQAMFSEDVAAARGLLQRIDPRVKLVTLLGLLVAAALVALDRHARGAVRRSHSVWPRRRRCRSGSSSSGCGCSSRSSPASSCCPPRCRSSPRATSWCRCGTGSATAGSPARASPRRPASSCGSRCRSRWSCCSR